jgi:outer membrane protein assembly factor BamD (BamD/ComL family)
VGPRADKSLIGQAFASAPLDARIGIAGEADIFGYTPRMLMALSQMISVHRRVTIRVVVAGFFVAVLTATALGAPRGWELRNGSWVPTVAPGADTPDAIVATMIQELNDGNTKKVISDAKKWIKANRKHPLTPQVLLLEGDAETVRGNKYRSLYSYEDLLTNFPTSELYVTALQREYDAADAFLLGYKRKFLGLRILPVSDDAIELLNRIQDRERGSALAERAGMRIADYYYDHGEFDDASDAYSDFLRRYPYSQFVRKAEIRRAQSSIAKFRGPKFDITPLQDGRERMTVIEQNYPQTSVTLQTKALDDRVYQEEGKKELEIARYYWRAGKKYASKYYYKRVIANWPDTQMAIDARKELLRRFPQEVGK